MEPPSDDEKKASPYWIPGARTRSHRYYYPSDNRPGFALMLLLGVLGLVAIAVAMTHLINDVPVQPQHQRLAALGVLAAAVGLYQAYRLRR